MSHGHRISLGVGLVQKPVLGHFITPRLRRELGPDEAAGGGRPWREPRKARPTGEPGPGPEGGAGPG
ncbi:MAG TPA: hypothetical protein VFS43_37505 [Polyangiaceae bacterium]|nr:hypothetical protein [Polyangiaceae bacterium]